MFRSARITGRRVPLAVFVVLTTVLASVVIGGAASAAVPFEIQSFDGSGNNVANPTWGRAGLPYARVAAARYTDGRGTPFAGASAARRVRRRTSRSTRPFKRSTPAPGTGVTNTGALHLDTTQCAIG